MDKCVGPNRSYTALLLIQSKIVSKNQGEIWTNIHLGTAILCASLPTFPPLLRHLLAFCNDTASRLSALLLASRAVGKSVSQDDTDDNNGNNHNQLNNFAGDKKLFTDAVVSESGSWSTESRTEMNESLVRDVVDDV